MSVKRRVIKAKPRVQIKSDALLIIAIESPFIKHLNVHVIPKIRPSIKFLNKHSKRQTINSDKIT